MPTACVTNDRAGMICPSKFMHRCIIRKLMMISTRILRPWTFGGILRQLEPAERLPLRTGVIDAIVVVEGHRAAFWTDTGHGPLMPVRVMLTSTWSTFIGE